MLRRFAIALGVLSCPWRSALIVFLLCGVFVSIATQVPADVILPTGLAPGSQYQIAFVTAGGTTAASSNIADYNSFVTAEADRSDALAALGATWSAIVSTDTTDARDNVATYANVPIYNTAGQVVVSSTGQLWGPGGDVGGIENPIRYDEYGNVSPRMNACTGSWATGQAVSGQALGQFYYNSANDYWESPWLGLIDSTSYQWMNWGYWHDKGLSVVEARHFYFYALSSPITVPAPEPSGFALLATGAIGLAAYGLRRRREARHSACVAVASTAAGDKQRER